MLEPDDLRIAGPAERLPTAARMGPGDLRTTLADSGAGHHDARRVRDVLLRHGFNIRRAAMDYGVSRVTMYRLIRRFDIPMGRRRTIVPAKYEWKHQA